MKLSPNELAGILREELGIERFSAVKQREILNGFGEVVMTTLMHKVLGTLSPEHQKELKEKIENDASSEEMEDFMRSRVDGFDELMEQAVKETLADLKEKL